MARRKQQNKRAFIYRAYSSNIGYNVKTKYIYISQRFGVPVFVVITLHVSQRASIILDVRPRKRDINLITAEFYRPSSHIKSLLRSLFKGKNRTRPFAGRASPRMIGRSVIKKTL